MRKVAVGSVSYTLLIPLYGAALSRGEIAEPPFLNLFSLPSGPQVLASDWSIMSVGVCSRPARWSMHWLEEQPGSGQVVALGGPEPPVTAGRCRASSAQGQRLVLQQEPEVEQSRLSGKN
jgi:hypothetical protein